MPGDLILELSDAQLKTNDLGPQAVAFGGEFDDAFGHLCHRVLSS